MAHNPWTVAKLYLQNGGTGQVVQSITYFIQRRYSRPDARVFFIGLGEKACAVAPPLMLFCDTLAIIFTRNLSPLENSISQYAIGSFGWLEKIGIISVAISFLLLGMNIMEHSGAMKSGIARLAGILFLMVGAGFLVISVFGVDASNEVTSLHGWIHMSAAIGVALIFPLACLVLFFILTGRNKPGILPACTAFTGLIGLAAAVWIAFPSNREVWMGLSERLLAGLNLAWIALAGSKTIRECKETQKTSQQFQV